MTTTNPADVSTVVGFISVPAPGSPHMREYRCEVRDYFGGSWLMTFRAMASPFSADKMGIFAATLREILSREAGDYPVGASIRLHYSEARDEFYVRCEQAEVPLSTLSWEPMP